MGVGMSESQFWVHGMPARNIDQVIDYLSGDAHDRTKVQWHDGKNFITVVDRFPIGKKRRD